MPDIPRIYTAAAEWMACMLFIVSLKKRFEWWKSGLIMAGMLVLQSVFLVATGNVPIYFWIPCMIAAVSLMVGFIYFCCDVNFQDAGYFGMIAFVVAEFMASLEWQIVCSIWTRQLPGAGMQVLMLAAVYGAVAFLLWKLFILKLVVLTCKNHLSSLLILNRLDALKVKKMITKMPKGLLIF